jgi:hypothetical protein
MGKFIAKLTGESDGYFAAREFNDFADAQAWLRGEGLREFDDQPPGEKSSCQMASQCGSHPICRP